MVRCIVAVAGSDDDYRQVLYRQTEEEEDVKFEKHHKDLVHLVDVCVFRMRK